MTAQNPEFGRLELKYLIGERTAMRVRRQIASFCDEDENRVSGGAATRGYPVRSLYLDTPSLAFHRAKEQGHPERSKLRLRGYRHGSGFWLEHKRRCNDLVRKLRARFYDQPLEDAAHGRTKLPENDAVAGSAAEDFARLVCETGAAPTLLVRYDREAFVSHLDHYARVTFDRDIEFQRTSRWTLDGHDHAWHGLQAQVVPDAPRPLVVMEIKCEPAVPSWLVHVVRSNELRRHSISKYSLGIYSSRRLQGYDRLTERARGILR